MTTFIQQKLLLLLSFRAVDIIIWGNPSSANRGPQNYLSYYYCYVWYDKNYYCSTFY